MSYYYVCMQDLKDGTNPCTITAFNNYDDADGQLCYDTWYAIQNKENYNSIVCMILNSIGNCEKKVIKEWKEPEPPVNESDEVE